MLLLVSCGRRTPPPSNYREIDVKDGGSISGTVRYAGAKPPADPIIIEKDQDACGTSHPNTSNPGPGESISGAIVYLDSIARGKSFAGMSPTATLDQKSCDFVPHVQIIKSGTSIIVSNSDKVLHNFHVWYGLITVMNEAQPEGAPPHEIMLPESGLHVVKCDVHPWMRGFIMAVDHPYYAITDSTGHFTLSNVPPGHYTLKMWRDNWSIDQPRGRTGHVSDYNWGSDFRNQKEVDVRPNAVTTADFSLP
ncbi:MAG: carboxypeptidase regulatory-like domain-containing protein [Bacteroidota bacterium]|nr:carboxypeptidase regulatory-like domain-containing protein [Bacteroidota bacterium]MDP4234407.1 carboxypeptidase regulatory-like domain-containing protein [Bacteroidota bacterium]MDP4243339.1 carboxypeptidase regulatory-like domain-containing protein [Bacteroidota bacterium]MDP4288025.1 carboxypeptidase regulatory-like domain-containing protein [Bacteroidota bacterium]